MCLLDVLMISKKCVGAFPLPPNVQKSSGCFRPIPCGEYAYTYLRHISLRFMSLICLDRCSFMLLLATSLMRRYETTLSLQDA